MGKLSTYIENQHISQIYGDKKIHRFLSNNIPISAEHVMGREKELEEIRSHLSGNNPAVLVNGVGGIGKTALATKYLVGNNEYYRHLAWLTVSSSIREAFVNNHVLLNNLHIAKKVEELLLSQQPDLALGLVINTLSNLDRTLVVLDNANDKEDITPYRQQFTRSNCHFLLTSRVNPDGWKTVSVDSLSMELAVSLFKRHFEKTEDSDIPDKKIEHLVQKLFRHTLLIELIAKAARKRNMPFEKLESIIEERWVKDPELNKVGIDTGEHGNTDAMNLKRAKVNEYIFFIFKNISSIPEKHREILKAFALLPPAEEMDEADVESLFKTLSIEFDLDEVEQIVETGWLQKNKETHHFSVHPLITEVVIGQLKPHVDWATPYIKTISLAIRYNDLNPEHDLAEKNASRPYAERLRNLFFNEDNLDLAELLNDLGFLDKNYGFYSASKILRQRALDIANNLLEDGHETIARYHSNLATVLKALGDYQGAKTLLEKAHGIFYTSLGTEHPNTKIIKGNLDFVISLIEK